MSETVTIVEAADMLGLHRDTVRNLIKRGQLKAYKKTLSRTGSFMVYRDSIIDYDRRRRELTAPAH